MARTAPIITRPIIATVTAFALILLVALGGAAQSEASGPSDAVKAAERPLKGPPIVGVTESEANASVTQACTRAKKQLKKAKKQLKKAKKSGNKQKIKKAKKKVKRAKKKKKKACNSPPAPTPPAPTPPANLPPEFPDDALRWYQSSTYYSGGRPSYVDDYWEVQPAVDPDGDSLTYSWEAMGDNVTSICAGYTGGGPEGEKEGPDGCSATAPPGYPQTAAKVSETVVSNLGDYCFVGYDLIVTVSDGRGGEDQAKSGFSSNC